MSLDRSRWVPCKNGYLLPALVLSKRFRRKLLDRIKQMYHDDALDLGGSSEPLEDPDTFQRLIDSLYAVDWVVYLKRSFPEVHSVVEYLARYTHRIAISN